jgi:hypothetical protein
MPPSSPDPAPLAGSPLQPPPPLQQQVESAAALARALDASACLATSRSFAAAVESRLGRMRRAEALRHAGRTVEAEALWAQLMAESADAAPGCCGDPGDCGGGC